MTTLRFANPRRRNALSGKSNCRAAARNLRHRLTRGVKSRVNRALHRKTVPSAMADKTLRRRAEARFIAEMDEQTRQILAAYRSTP